VLYLFLRKNIQELNDIINMLGEIFEKCLQIKKVYKKSDYNNL
jgi:hypothetical protein